MASLNFAGVCLETIAAEYEADAALQDWLATNPKTLNFPPREDYFWAAWGAELELRNTDTDHARAGLRWCSHRIT